MFNNLKCLVSIIVTVASDCSSPNPVGSDGRTPVTNCTFGTDDGVCVGTTCRVKEDCTDTSYGGIHIAGSHDGKPCESSGKLGVCETKSCKATRAFADCTEDGDDFKYCKDGNKKGYCNSGDCVDTEGACTAATDDFKICNKNGKLGVCNRGNECVLPVSSGFNAWKMVSECPSTDPSDLDFFICIKSDGKIGRCGASEACDVHDIPSTCASAEKTTGKCFYTTSSGGMDRFGNCGKGSGDIYDCYGTCGLACTDDFEEKTDGVCLTWDKCKIDGDDPGCCVPKGSGGGDGDAKDEKGAATRSGLLKTACLSFVF